MPPVNATPNSQLFRQVVRRPPVLTSEVPQKSGSISPLLWWSMCRLHARFLFLLLRFHHHLLWPGKKRGKLLLRSRSQKHEPTVLVEDKERERMSERDMRLDVDGKNAKRGRKTKSAGERLLDNEGSI